MPPRLHALRTVFASMSPLTIIVDLRLIDAILRDTVNASKTQRDPAERIVVDLVVGHSTAPLREVTDPPTYDTIDANNSVSYSIPISLLI
jgi:hypothetical protein